MPNGWRTIKSLVFGIDLKCWMRAAQDAPEWYSKVETGAEVFMSAWSTKRVNESNARHAKELFATLPFELPWCRFECRRRVAGDFSRCYTGVPWSQCLTVRCPPPSDWWGVLSDSRPVSTVVWFRHLVCLACLFICFSDMRGGSLLLFFALVLFFPSPPIRSGEAFSSVIFSSLSLLLFVFVGCSGGMEREACVCDHGFERSDLCA